MVDPSRLPSRQPFGRVGVHSPRVHPLARVSSVAGPPNPLAPKYIIDTDYAGDPDDLVSLGVAIAAHNAGTINLIGIVVSSSLDTSAPGVYGFLKAYGLTYIPVYAYQGANGTYNNTYSAQIRDRFGVVSQSRTAYTDDLTGLKALLNASADASIKMVSIGGKTALSSLLTDSPALVTAKVISLYTMGGQFPDSSAVGGPEYNITRDIAAAQNVYANWPTPIIAHGAEVGALVVSGPPLWADPLLDPIKYGIELYAALFSGAGLTGNGMASRWTRSSWDPLCVYHAIYGNGSNFGAGGSNGTITIDGAGNTLWTSTPGTRTYANKVASDPNLGTMLNAVIDAVEPTPIYATGFTIGFTEGAGQFAADPAVSDMRFWRGCAEITQTADPTWTDLGGGKWVWDFDGTNDVASMQDRAGFAGSNFVMGVLAKFTSVTASRVLMCKEDGLNGSHWNLRNNAGKLEFIGRIDSNNTASVISSGSASDITTATWMMLTASVLGTAVILRRDGVQIGTGTMSGVVYPTSVRDRVLLGARNNSTPAIADLFQGQMAGVYLKAGAVAGDLATMETALRAIAATKGITIP